jgi:hypothetical protein
MGGQSTANEAVGDALCVVQKNTEIAVTTMFFYLVYFLCSDFLPLRVPVFSLGNVLPRRVGGVLLCC